MADGTVAYAGTLNGYGNTVVIDYGDGYTGVYTGLSSIAVGSGGSVKRAGQSAPAAACRRASKACISKSATGLRQ